VTLRQGGIIALLDREPMSTFTLAVALNERIPDVARDLNKLAGVGVVEHCEDGWKLTERVAA